MAATHFKGPLTITNGPLTIGAAALTEAQIGALDDLDTTELAALEGITPGTAAASKAVVLDASKGISTITSATITTLTSTTVNATTVDATTLEINNVAVGSTAAEIDVQCDVSAQTETIDSGVAVSVTKRITKIDNTVTGAGAITLAAPDATMLGMVKIIEMTVDGGDVTLALTNVDGGSAATTATFDAVGDALVLVAGVSKWHVCSETAALT